MSDLKDFQVMLRRFGFKETHNGSRIEEEQYCVFDGPEGIDVDLCDSEGNLSCFSFYKDGKYGGKKLASNV